MSNQQWTRAHDALIAERAKGLKVFRTASEWWVETATGHWPLDHYLTDLAASARAQEAWRLQDANVRSYRLISPHIGDYKWTCEMFGGGSFRSREVSESAARAWATWRACGGAE